MRIYPTKRQIKYLVEIGVFQAETDRKSAIKKRRTTGNNDMRNVRSIGELTNEFVRKHINPSNMVRVILVIIALIVFISA